MRISYWWHPILLVVVVDLFVRFCKFFFVGMCYLVFYNCYLTYRG